MCFYCGRRQWPLNRVGSHFKRDVLWTGMWPTSAWTCRWVGSRADRTHDLEISRPAPCQLGYGALQARPVVSDPTCRPRSGSVLAELKQRGISSAFRELLDWPGEWRRRQSLRSFAPCRCDRCKPLGLFPEKHHRTPWLSRSPRMGLNPTGVDWA